MDLIYDFQDAMQYHEYINSTFQSIRAQINNILSIMPLPNLSNNSQRISFTGQFRERLKSRNGGNHYDARDTAIHSSCDQSFALIAICCTEISSRSKIYSRRLGHESASVFINGPASSDSDKLQLKRLKPEG